MNAINQLIEIAQAEIGYLEKADCHDLYDKTANAGGRNYTKYWADIKPGFQGQPWCAVFVTWCFVQAFGEEKAKELLGHFPFVYCPTLGSKFFNHANPEVGDIVLFKRNGEFVHTGIVVSVAGDYFKTIEGNTSGGSTIIANGGGVFKKGYYNSLLPGTKFIRPNYQIIEEELTMAQYDELNDRLKKIEGKMIYNYVDENMPDWARPTVQKMLNNDLLVGNENGELGLTDEMLRIFVINDRAGLYGE